MERTRIVTERAIAYLEKNPYIEYIQNVTGSSPRVGSNQGRAELTVILKPWEERKSTTIEKIMDTVEKHLRNIPNVKSICPLLRLFRDWVAREVLKCNWKPVEKPLSIIW